MKKPIPEDMKKLLFASTFGAYLVARLREHEERNGYDRTSLLGMAEDAICVANDAVEAAQLCHVIEGISPIAVELLSPKRGPNG